MNQPDVLIDADTRRHVVEGVAQALDTMYVFPDAGHTMSEALLAALEAHDYDGLTTSDAFCERLTHDLQAVSSDKHIRVRYNEEARTIGGSPEEPSAEELAQWIAQARSVNFGFYKVERLAGNVGYLDLRNFWDVTLPGAGETALAAMNLLYHTDALIVDLRKNGGGSPSMIAFLTSFLVNAEPVHLNSFYERQGDKTRQVWTLPYIPGPRTPDKPVYVLTGNRTFSGAEEFAYNLKNLKRATIIGETTGGGAHPGGDISVTPHFRVFVPIGRPINAISGTNWEGTGVEPDISVPQEEALNHAYRLALAGIIANLGDNPTGAGKTQAAEARSALEEQRA
ncbi:MAG TPA: S41 family peptidase [Chloroflexia bacterium]|nr:S41 family peptidase [Chloroflexia bacterium]